MRSLFASVKRWAREKKAAGFIVLLNNASDVRAVLLTHRGSIDDSVIDELLTHSYYISKTESLEEGLRWAKAAHEASLLGGSAASLASCLKSEALLLLNLHRRDTAAESPALGRAYLDEALSCAQKALEIVRDAGISDEIPPALGLVSTLFENRGEPLAALQHRLLSLIGWAELPDAADALPTLLDNLARLFEQLDGDALGAGSKLLLARAEELNKIADRRLNVRGKLHEILGTAHRGLDSCDDAFLQWEQAAKYYRDDGNAPEEFRLLARMQEYGIKVGRLDAAIRWGEECVRRAPDDPEPYQLADRYRYLAATYKWAGRTAEAAAAHHRAASLYLREKDGSYHAGGCLLQAAIFEEEIGMFDKAREDIERAMRCSGGTYSFWLARTTMARLLSRRYGNLGAAAEHADEAVQIAMSTSNRTLRAASLYLSGYLHLLAGDNERTLTRTEALMSLLSDDLPATMVNLDKLYGHGVLPPLPSEAAMLGLLASIRLRRPEEARRYGEMCTSFADEKMDWPGLEEFAEEGTPPEDVTDLIQGLKCLARGERLAFVNPREALPFLEEASSLFRKHDVRDHLVAICLLMALAKLSLEDVEGSAACTREALELIKQAPNHAEEFTCRYQLGILSARAGDDESAYEHLKAAVMLIDAQRQSLGGDRQRLLFLEVGPYLDAYTGLAACCVYTRRSREALETVEKIKSRVFLDLLAQRGRINYAALGELHELSKERDRWVRLYAATDDERLDEERRIALLQNSISLRERTDSLQQHLQDGGFFIRLSVQDVPLSFGEIRELCRTD